MNMRLTERGKNLIAILLVILCFLAIILAWNISNRANGSTPPMNPVPNWMTKDCRYFDNVNCYWGHDSHDGPYYVRVMPHDPNWGGKTGLVCVFYVRHPRLDYCA